MKEVIIIGGSGHGKVVANIIRKSGDRIIGFLDDNKSKKKVLQYPVIDTVENAEKYKQFFFIVAIGNNKLREFIVKNHAELTYYSAIDPDAVIDPSVEIGRGTVVMANAVVNADTKIGEHCIINTSSVVEHDCVINDFVHISPNATLCGTVKIGKLSHIGASATIINNLIVRDNVTVGAGGTVVSDIIQNGLYIGCPAKKRRK